MSLNTMLLSACIATVLLAGCKKAEDASAATVETPAAEPASAAEAPAAAVTPEVSPAAMPAFDLGKIAVSDKPLPAWPYVAVPEGYAFDDATTKDLARVPFWTGDHLEFVEGKVYQARVRPVDEKTYSSFEVLKRIDQSLTALGAVRITDSKLPQDVLDTDLPENFGTEFNAGSGGYYGGQASNVYVLRTSEHAIWVKAFSNENEGSLLIAEGDAPAAPN